MARLAPVQYTRAFAAAGGAAARVGGAVALDAITLAVRVHRNLPTSAAIAANGDTLIDTISIPLVPSLLDPLTAATGVGWVHLDIPLLLIPDLQTRFLSLVVTAGAKDITGVAALVVDRPDEEK
jgi:hypothetical protein